MFKHILVPTDGSDLSQETSRQAVSFAKDSGARITAVHAKPKMTSAYGSFYAEGGQADLSTKEQLDKIMDKEAQKNLRFVADLCRDAGVECHTLVIASDSPYEAILDAAGQSGADLIFMASHGRKGVKALLLGSETHRVLTHARIPVLVYRWGEANSTR